METSEQRRSATLWHRNVNVVTPLLQKPRYEGLTVLPNLSKEEPMGIVGKTVMKIKS